MFTPPLPDGRDCSGFPFAAGSWKPQIQGMELVFSVTQEADGGFVAECLSHDIFTQADTWEDLRDNVREAVSAFFFDQPKPSLVRLHLVHDETLVPA
jgi:hypothetical protein